MAARRGAAAPAGLLLALAAGCARPPGALGEATLQALGRPGAYLTGEVTSLRREGPFEEGALATAVSASRHAELVAFTALAGEDATLTAIDRSGGSPHRLWVQRLNAGHREVEAVEVSPDGSMIATAGRDGFLRTFRSRTGVPGAALGLRQPLVSMAMRGDGAQLAVGTSQGRVVVVAFPELQLVASAELHGGQEVRGVAYRADGAILSGGWDRTVVLSRQEGGDLREEKRRALQQYVNDVQVGGAAAAVALSASPAERTPELASRQRAPEEPAPANAVALLDAATLDEVVRPVRHRGVVSTAAVAPDGLVFASGGWDGRVVVEQRDAPPQRAPLEEGFDWLVRRVRVTRDARFLLVAAWARPAPSGQRAPPSILVEELVRPSPEVAREAPAPRP
ncbi:MAG TPA: WD40 repeat domain-containing protein [Myxococcales bacterium]|nr:WD40 repeat domain-containing protein [Myxococcales bacterium]